MTINRQPVNTIPNDLPSSRLETLLAAYRRQLHDPRPDDPPRWYSRAMVDALQASLAARPVTA